jgi:hypothetical protein
MPIYRVESTTQILAGNPGAVGPVGNPADVTREFIVGPTPKVPGIGFATFVEICIAPPAVVGSCDVTLLRTSVSDGGGNPQLRYLVRNNRQTASEFRRISLVVFGIEFSPPP